MVWEALSNSNTPALQYSIFGIKDNFRHYLLIALLAKQEQFMWYFAWILGVLLACAFGIINVMWMETEEMLGSEGNSED